MSETTQNPAPAPAEKPYVPQESLQAEENVDYGKPDAGARPDSTPPVEAEKAENEAEKAENPEEDPAKAERRREAARLGYLTKQRYAEKARADQAEARIREYEERLQALERPGEQRQLTQEDFERAVEQRAAQRVAAEQHSSRVEAWDKAGTESFGMKPFRDACETVANLATPEQRAALLQVAMDVEGGQRAIVELAANAEEAERVLAMPPHRMALHLAKLGGAAPAAPPRVSQTPAPHRPPSVGRSGGVPDPEKGSMADFLKWSRSSGNWRR